MLLQSLHRLLVDWSGHSLDSNLMIPRRRSMRYALRDLVHAGLEGLQARLVFHCQQFQRDLLLTPNLDQHRSTNLSRRLIRNENPIFAHIFHQKLCFAGLRGSYRVINRQCGRFEELPLKVEARKRRKNQKRRRSKAMVVAKAC